MLGYLLYQIYKKYYSRPPKKVIVSLLANRSDLLAEQRKIVNERRRQIKGESSFEKSVKAEYLKKENENTEPVDPIETGFGDDLGFAIEQVQEENAITLVKRRSRFADMKNAAEELKDIYNRNSKI
ncbi:hypothetical protein [Telluribacter humicola]|uniref:hypothetical protein n=1 Tax=Telluribacter humicola TaxID=1720261 RepID=UPI001A96783C|nr:hypothetical protein [Telluribacter humicola]